MKLSILQLLRWQFYTLPEVDTFKADLTGKTVIVTGANIGLGLEAARHFARMNPGKLILACRDVKKGQAAQESIVKDTSCSTIEVWELDLGSFLSVTAFADRFEKEGGGKLDLLIENAGINTGKYAQTDDGWEKTLQVNHLATALLAIRLIPYLEKAPASPPTPRLVIVTSELHYWADLKEASAPKMLEMLSSEEHCKEWGVMGQRYPVSKLLNVLFTRALASRVPASAPYTVNTVNPGFCHSALTREVDNPIVWLVKLLLARSTEVGSRTLVHAAVAPELQGKSGVFLNACDVYEPSDLVISEKGKVLQERLWAETVEVLTKVDPKVTEIITEHLGSPPPNAGEHPEWFSTE